MELMNTVQTRVKPKYHVYGHIHEGKRADSVYFSLKINFRLSLLQTLFRQKDGLFRGSFKRASVKGIIEILCDGLVYYLEAQEGFIDVEGTVYLKFSYSAQICGRHLVQAF